ncbi:3609_t:CDS:2 [Paraglomus occultum]|uniref:3609_t:CDS:1 n=1 Tax=Paraglomus occultum TaxID=144539 RepID=A0A9N9BM24_9GLOM|nr:3609_t:CDS:2 [Paraglomus occultum]
MSPKSECLAHALVLQFLEQKGYSKALAAFKEEAGSIIAEDKLAGKPRESLTKLVDEYAVGQLGSKMNKLSLKRQIEDDLSTHGANHYPQHLYETLPKIHTSNILTVRTQILPISNFIDNDYISSQVPTLVTGSADKTVKITSLLTGDTISIFSHHSGGVLCVDFHPQYPSLMLTASLDGTAALIDVVKNDKVQIFKDLHSKPIVKAKFSNDGNLFVTASYDHTLNFFKMVPPVTPTTPVTPATPQTPRSPTYVSPTGIKYVKIHTMKFPSALEAIAFLPDGHTLIVSIRENNYLHYIDLLTFNVEKYNMNANGDDHVSFTAMDISPSPHNNGAYILVSTDKSRVILFRTRSSEQLRNFYGVTVGELFTPRHCWHPSGKYFFVNDGDGQSVSVVDVVEEKILRKLEGHEAQVRDLWFDSERELLITCGFDKTVIVWGCDESAKIAS